MTTIGKLARRAAMTAVATALVATGAYAMQAVEDGSVPMSNLNIPQNLQIFGKVDPNVRKPTAIVNDTVITGTDVDHRIAMISSLNDVKLSPEDMERLKLQVLRQLIDETLQIQEAKAQDITISSAEIDQYVVRFSRSLKKTPEELREYLRAVGSSERTLRRQMEGELAWQRLLRRRVAPFVNVGEEEVKALLDRLKAQQGTDEYHLKEIYLTATPERQQEVIGNARKMIEQMREGAPFEYFARTFSEASTKAVGGDLDWVKLGVLPDSLQAAAQQLEVGQIAGPIEVPGGYSILYLVDKRQVLTADPRDARLNLRQLTVKFAPGTTQAQATQRASGFATALQSLQGCGGVAKVAAETGAEVVDNDSVRVRDLPPQLQEIILKLQIGQATPPFGNPEDGIRTLVLCGRDDPQTASLPDAEQLQSRIEEQRVNLRAQRMLRDLRRDALVEYR